MAKDKGGAEEEKDKLGRYLLQILAQEDTLASVLAELEDLKAKLRGYDYTGKVYKDLAIDPTTKALLVKLDPTHAVDVNITDTGGYFTAKELESALQELGPYMADIDGFPDELKNLITHEIEQIENIPGDVDILAAQWVALGALVEWTAWVPTLTGDADLSGYDCARYYRIGDICFFYFEAASKNVTTSGVIQVTLPFTVANTAYQIPSAVVNDGSAWIGQPHIMIAKNADYVSVYKNAAGGNWAGTETGVTIRISGFFEIA